MNVGHLRILAGAVLLGALGQVLLIETAQVHLLLGQRLNPDGSVNTQRSLHHLETAVRLEPANPSLLVALAEQRLTLSRQDNDPVQAGMALDALRLAVVAGPERANTWTGLLVAKSSLGELDNEWLRSIKTAVELGPYDPEVQLRIIRVGAHLWLQLTPTSRDIVVSTAVRALQSQSEWRAREILATLRQYKLDRLVCSALENTQESRPGLCSGAN